MLTSVVGMVVLLGGLIFFHEFGHYGVAKLFGVKVEVFSLGFGKKILKRTVGETEYCLSLIPLGGYVKLMGDDPYKGVPADEAERAFCTQALYKRFLIVAAGPIANLLLAYALFTAVFWVGKPMQGPTIGDVVLQSPAWQAGLLPQDKVLTVDGLEIATWNELEESLEKREGEEVVLTVQRGSETVDLPVTVNQVSSRNPYGEDVLVGGIKGIAPYPSQPMVAVSNPESPAYQAGIRTGDVILEIGDKELQFYSQLNPTLAEVWDSPKSVPVKVKRFPVGKPDDFKEVSYTLALPQAPPEAELGPLGLSAALGLYPSEVAVQMVTPESPAEKGGLQPGDRISKIGDEPIYSFEGIVDQVQEWGKKGQSVNVQLERAGRTLILNLKPEKTVREDPLTRKDVEKYMLGFAPRMAFHEGEVVTLQIRSVGAVIQKAFSETNLLAERMVISIWKLLTGQISVKNLGGPVLIATVAGKSLDAGIIPFIQMMALISINLFLLNLLPVPILDGGHLLFFMIEGVKGKPVSIRTMEIANQAGMVLILMLVGLTLFNDISRIVMN